MTTDEPTTLERVAVRMFLPQHCQAITPRIARQRTWESECTQWILANIRRGDTFVDIGAHVGYFALIAAKTVGEEGHVFAFEPDPTNYSTLARNVILNGFRNVTLEQMAVTNRNDRIRLYLSETNSGDHRILFCEEPRQSIQVDCVTIDDYFRDRGPTPRIDFVKIDTQGAEVFVLQGMRKTLRLNPDARLIVEFWPYGLFCLGTNAGELLRILESHGFILVRAEQERLLATYTVENRRHTNLMLHRSGFKACA